MLKDEIMIQRLADLVRDLIVEQGHSICKSMNDAFIENDTEKFAYPFSVTAKIKPVGNEYDVELRCSHSIRHVADVKETIAPAQMDLLDSAVERAIG